MAKTSSQPQPQPGSQPQPNPLAQAPEEANCSTDNSDTKLVEASKSKQPAGKARAKKAGYPNEAKSEIIPLKWLGCSPLQLKYLTTTQKYFLVFSLQRISGVSLTNGWLLNSGEIDFVSFITPERSYWTNRHSIGQSTGLR